MISPVRKNEQHMFERFKFNNIRMRNMSDEYLQVGSVLAYEIEHAVDGQVTGARARGDVHSPQQTTSSAGITVDL